MTRKRRTVLWLYNEDYEHLRAVAGHDVDTKKRWLDETLRKTTVPGILESPTVDVPISEKLAFYDDLDNDSGVPWNVRSATRRTM